MSAKYAFIRREEGVFPTGLMIWWMGVSKSGYYDWRDRPLSARARRRQELEVIVRWHFEDSDGTYGYRRIAAAMNAAGQHVDPGTVKSIMAQQGLVAAQPQVRAEDDGASRGSARRARPGGTGFHGQRAGSQAGG